MTSKQTGVGTMTSANARCPTCGGKLYRKATGRPRLQVPVQKVLDAVRSGESVTSVANRFKISRASVYRITAAHPRGTGTSLPA
ncbi:helix-turn-helix domain-containing protein [SAR202 cluster bacterium AD-804-J14_MRT_500m]|nr:helix-turn-helix domain-containing protein [SAR202 cluster bacterium AD-804-J14_MRT_500m]